MIALDRRTFSHALDLTGAAIDRRSTIAALGMLKATAASTDTGTTLRLEGSDLDIFSVAELDCIGDPAELVLPDPARLRDAINAACGEAVSIHPEELNTLRLESDRFAATLFALPHGDHPGAELVGSEAFSATLGPDELRQIARVMPAISDEEIRYYLHGVCVHRVDETTWRFAATNGHMLMTVDVPLPGATGTIPDGTILPAAWLRTVMKRFRAAKEGATLTFGIKAGVDIKPGFEATRPLQRIQIAARLGKVRFTLAGKVIDGDYPDYAKVIPTDLGKSAGLKRSDLARAINTLSSLAIEKTPAVKLAFTDGLCTLELAYPDLGNSRYAIPATWQGEPGEFEIAFNSQYLRDFCKALTGDDIQIGMKSPSDPAMFTDPADPAFMAVLMPGRITK